MEDIAGHSWASGIPRIRAELAGIAIGSQKTWLPGRLKAGYILEQKEIAMGV
jgi:hypothetical protein